MQNSSQLAIDFGKSAGKVNPRLYGSGMHPFIANRHIRDTFDQFKDLGFTEVRNHDWALNNPGQRMVDVHFVFPLMHLDADDPRNYYFKPTDEAFRLCYEAGSRVYYRLGTSIEHTEGVHFNTVPPEDPVKFAHVCEHIIRHYTEGWSDGFHYDMPCWEIWNEPEGKINMWTGTKDQFAVFFAEVLAHLKKCFPHLKIGGPANCSFNEEWLSALMKECKARNVKPDFYSYHRYGFSPEGQREQILACRKFLDENGWTGVEMHLNEWHFIRSWKGVHSNITEASYQRNMYAPDGLLGMNSAAYNVAVYSVFHDVKLDAAYYYGCGTGTWGMTYPSTLPNKNYYSMLVMRDLVKGYSELVSVQRNSKNHYALAAVSPDRREAYLAISDFCSPDMAIEVALENCPGAKVISCTVLDDTRNNEGCEAYLEDGRLVLEKNAPGSAVFVVKLALA